MTSPQRTALDALLELAGNANAGAPSERARALALQWPSLAAALADLLAAHEVPVPRPWRTAANVVAAEPMRMRAIAAMGSCLKCGHVQHQHHNAPPFKCGLCFCSGWEFKVI